jgi:hypothetical protein
MLRPVQDPFVNTFYESGVMNGLIDNDDIIIRCSAVLYQGAVDFTVYIKNKGKNSIKVAPGDFLMIRSYTAGSNSLIMETNVYSFGKAVLPLNKARQDDKNAIAFSETNALARDYDYRMIDENYDDKIEAVRLESLSGRSLEQNGEISGHVKFSLPEKIIPGNYCILQMPVGNEIYRIKFALDLK